MLVVGFSAGASRANRYPLVAGPGRDRVVVDPGEDVADGGEAASAEHERPAGVLVTHGHFDHAASVASVADTHGVPVWTRPPGPAVALPAAASRGGRPARRLRDRRLPARGDRPRSRACGRLRGFRLGGRAGGRVAPTGDTLPAGSAGSADPPGGDRDRQAEPPRAKLFGLPEETVVLPGHGPATTIGREKATNPFLTGGL